LEGRGGRGSPFLRFQEDSAVQKIRVAVAKTRILQGSHLDVTGLSKGKHLFQCCIHPWMRMEVDVK
ncbi:MAG: hypothetical protein WBQ86_23445, partial [Candidatus Binatus sp.]